MFDSVANKFTELFSSLAGKKKLTEEISMSPRKRDDWSIKETVACSCSDCKKLAQYLRSGTTQIKSWPLAKARRAHIHQTIDGMGVPVTHNTQRQGRPYSLVLRKTNQLYKQEERRRKLIKTKFPL